MSSYQATVFSCPGTDRGVAVGSVSSAPGSDELSRRVRAMTTAIFQQVQTEPESLNGLFPQVLEGLSVLDGIFTAPYAQAQCAALKCPGNLDFARALDEQVGRYSKGFIPLLRELRESLAGVSPENYQRLLTTVDRSWHYYLQTQRERGRMLLTSGGNSHRVSGGLSTEMQSAVRDSLAVIKGSVEMLSWRCESSRRSAWDTILKTTRAFRVPLFEAFRETALRWHSQSMALDSRGDLLSGRLLLSNTSDSYSLELLNHLRHRQDRRFWSHVLKMKALRSGKLPMDYWNLRAPLAGTLPEVSSDGIYELHRAALGGLSPVLLNMIDGLRERGGIHFQEDTGESGNGAKCVSFGPAGDPLITIPALTEIYHACRMIHESMHACGTILASRAGNNLVYEAPEWVREGLSGFGELVQLDYLRRVMPRQADILSSVLLDKMYLNFNFLGAHLLSFEEKAHQAIIEGKEPVHIDQIYQRELKECFGDMLRIDDGMAHAWRGIPHIISKPFDTATRLLATCLTSCIYRRWQESKESSEFEASLLSVMSSGMQLSPEEMLRILGIDPDPDSIFKMHQSVLRELAGERR